MIVPFIDLRPQFNMIQAEVEEAVRNVFQNCKFVLGENVVQFEKEVEAYLGIPEAVAVGNGSDALYLSLLTFNVGPGDEVITTPFSFVATADAILRVGATPVFADIDPNTYNIDPAKIEERITPRTKAIMPVHLYGQCARMDVITNIAKKYSLIVIEDACQAFGADYLGRKAGTWGNAACFSFFPTKNLGGSGDGGMIVTANKSVADKLRMLRSHGSSSRYQHVLHGINSRLDEIQAAVLRVKLRYIDLWNQKRREIAKQYHTLLHNLPLALPFEQDDLHHIYHLYTVRTSNQSEREHLVDDLRQHGIETAIHYPKPIYLQPSYQQLNRQQASCPTAETVSDQICSIPLYPELSEEAVQHVANAIIAFYKGRRDS